jgi:acyl carrier protein
MKDNSLVYLEYIEAKVKEIMAELLDSSHDEQNLNASFVDLAISSVEAVELVEAINEKLGTGLGVEVVFDYRDVKELTTFIFQRYRNEFLSKELPLLTSEVQLSEEGNIGTASITPVIKEESTNDYKACRDETASSEQEAIPPTYPCSPYPERHSSDIAIIGISGKFAGSASIEAFWRHLQAGEGCIEQIRRKGWGYQYLL